jgi:hypothetical protein
LDGIVGGRFLVDKKVNLGVSTEFEGVTGGGSDSGGGSAGGTECQRAAAKGGGNSAQHDSLEIR